MKRVFILFLLGVWVWQGMATAGPARLYTLDDCLKSGRERSGRAANARRSEQSAAAGVKEARAEALPHLDLNGRYTRIDEVPSFDIGEGPIEVGTENNYGVSAGLSQLLYNGGQVRAALRAAKAYRDFAGEARRTADASLDRDICLAFYGVQLAEAETMVENESVQQLRRLVSRSEAQLSQRIIPEFELLSSRVRLANALPRQIAASNHLEVARETLRTLAYLEEGDYAIQGSLTCGQEALGLDQFLAKAMAGRAEIAQMEAQVRLRREDVKVAEAAYKPTLRAFGNYQGANSSTYSPMQTEWEWHWTAGVTAEWAFADGGRRAAVTLQKRLALESAETELRELRRAVTLEVRQVFLGLKHAEEAIRVASETEALAVKGLALASVRHEQGISTYLEFTETNLALSTARLQMLQALHTYCVARVQVRYAAGLPVKEDKDEKEPVAQ